MERRIEVEQQKTAINPIYAATRYHTVCTGTSLYQVLLQPFGLCLQLSCLFRLRAVVGWSEVEGETKETHKKRTLFVLSAI